MKLHNGELVIWQARLDIAPADQWKFLVILSPNEQERAQRYHFKRDRDRFIAARGILRTLLSDYLNTSACRIHFLYNDFGKPFLGVGECGDIQFNLSHSDGIAVYVFTQGQEAGIDIERIRPIENQQQIIQRYFAPAEQLFFATVPPQSKDEAFFRLWTRKEAYVKALGLGMSLPFDRFSVVSPGAQPFLVMCQQSHHSDNRHWAVQDVEVKSGFTCALAVEGLAMPEPKLRYWNS